MRLSVSLLIVALLGACGVDGPPIPPQAKTATPAATASGQ